MRTNGQLDFEREEEAVEIAQRIVADIDSKFEEDELKTLLENSGRNMREFEGRMRAIKFIERKKREQNKHDDSKFLFIILVYLCGVDRLVAGAFCSVSPAPAVC